MTRQTLSGSTLVLLAGVAGSGKSTVARGLLEHLHVVYLDNNFLADAFFPDTRRGVEYRQIRPLLYAALYRITAENLSVGNSVLLDAPHIRQSQSKVWYRSMLSLTRDTASRLVIIRCVASENEIRRRLEVRGQPRDQWKLQNWSTYVRSQPVARALPFPHLDLSTERSVVEAVDEAIRYIMTETVDSDSTR